LKKGSSIEKCSWVEWRPNSFNKLRAELTEDVVDAYDMGFEDALAQVACLHPEMDASPFVVLIRVVNGQIVPRILP